MEIMYLLVPVSVILVLLIGIVFWWSLRSGQYDDLEGPAYRVLMDKDKAETVPAEQLDGGPEMSRSESRENINQTRY